MFHLQTQLPVKRHRGSWDILDLVSGKLICFRTGVVLRDLRRRDFFSHLVLVRTVMRARNLSLLRDDLLRPPANDHGEYEQIAAPVPRRCGRSTATWQRRHDRSCVR